MRPTVFRPADPAVPLSVLDDLLGLAVPDDHRFRFVAADPRTRAIDGARYADLGAALLAAVLASREAARLTLETPSQETIP
jgi:hypothetical protein